MPREIVTLQVGHFANFVGTHWWNLQDASFIYDPRNTEFEKEINHDVMFREGQTLMGDVTFTPRLVSLDLKGSLNTLRQEGCLYDLPESADDVNWGCDVTMHKEMSSSKNEFLKDLERDEAATLGKLAVMNQDMIDCDIDKDASEEPESQECSQRIFGRALYDLDDSVHVWSDYLKVHLHPRSVCLVHQYAHQNELEPFDMYMYGQNVYRDQATQREIDDRIHYFIEESDNLQGFHVLSDLADGFGGISCALLENLEDELGKSHVLTFGVSPSSFPNLPPLQDTYRMINMVLSMDKMYTHSSALVPVSLAESYRRDCRSTQTLPYLTYNHGLAYHEAAILAAGLDTATLPYRLHHSHTHLSHLTQALTPAARKILRLCSCLPLPVPPGGSLTTVLDKMRLAGMSWPSLTPGCHTNTCHAQSVVIRGIPQTQNKRQVLASTEETESPMELLSKYVLNTTHCTHNALCVVNQACKTAAPFPNIFSPIINKDGCLFEQERAKDIGVINIGMLSSLQATMSLQNTLEPLVSSACSVRLGRYHHLAQSGLEVDEFSEVGARLQDLQDNYSDTITDMM